MRNLILYSLIVTFLLISGCSSDDTEINQEELNETLVALTNEEIADLLFLREEEKLARDVYLYSYDVYGLQIFKNISNSEQQHMNSVLQLLINYNLEDPASEIRGEFTNPDLQSIYNSLIEKSNISLLEALKVGNTIEDLDINDIAENEKRTTKSDLLNVYTLLKCGSKNHLRNYNKQVELNNGTYEPVYLTNDEFDAIVSTPNEQCGI